MNISPERLQYLFRQYTQRLCTWEEMQELFTCIAEAERKEELYKLMDEAYQKLPPADTEKINWDQMFHTIRRQQEKAGRVKTFRWGRMAAAVAVIIVSAVLIFLLIHKTRQQVPDQLPSFSQRYKNDITPGGNKAVLTLANGKVILLDSAHTGMLTRQGNTTVMKTAGQLEYDNQAGEAAGTMFNTITIPRGGQYKVVLPDGSRVWLNALSSIRFPVTFSHEERRVELNGEAYFEIAKEQNRPFKVAIQQPGHDMEVQVLGTHFNIMAYGDEARVSTTLLDGSVKLTNAMNKIILLPGQQGRQEGDGRFSIVQADTSSVVAWKNGYFQFDKADITTIMRQIARWYNVDITYEGTMPDNEFVGKIRRNVNLSVVLRILELSHVHFRIEGRKITVLP